MPTNIPKEDQRKWVSHQDLIETVLNLEDPHFDYPHEVLMAISDIVVIIHSSYEQPENNLQDFLMKIIKVLQSKPVAPEYMKISKSELSSKPLPMQLLIQMQHIITKRQYNFSNKKIIWLTLALHTSIVLTHHNAKTHAHNIAMQFKMAQFSGSAKRTWLWNSLPDIYDFSLDVENISSLLSTILKQRQNEIEAFDNSDAATLLKSDKTRSALEKKLGQIQKIHLAYISAFFLKNISKKSKKSKNKENNNNRKKVKAITLTKADPVLETSNIEPEPYYWDTTSDDIEAHIPKIDTRFFEPEIEVDEYSGLKASTEEKIDHYDRPYINYNKPPDPLINHSVPLQAIDITLQQNYMSQRDLELNSNTRILSLAGYQGLFNALSHDANESKKSTASLLLLSMLTGLPIKSLINPGYIGHPSIFRTLKNKAYIRHHLGVTKKSKKFDESIFENELDEVKIPLPLWLIGYLSPDNLPTKEALNGYLSKLRTSLQLPYLSINRIETALHVILSRYTPNCHSHIADIICRVPAPHAPAMYYSSHTSEELITHYKAALDKLNTNNNFDLSYITVWHKYTLGSAFAFKLDYVRKFMAELQLWVKRSPNADIHFNRTSILVWYVFCTLTGVRPNNGIGTISDLDLESGWLLIYDKPSKNVQNHRLVPLCPTLIRYLTDYQAYLINYQTRHPLKYEVSECVDEIRLGEDVALLRLLSDNADNLRDIKRGDAYQMTHEILDADPYWTRHFVRTQLEKYGVNLVLINTVIGHEKGRQEALGQLSSFSKPKIKSIAGILEHIAVSLQLKTIKNTTLHYYGDTDNA